MRVRCLLLVPFIVALAQPARAQLNISPIYMFLAEPARSQECVVRNPDDDTVEAWINFRYGFPSMDDTGKVTMVYLDSAQAVADVHNASSWLRAFPQRFVIPPQGAQVVRILVTPPPSLAEGEYWTRVVVTEKRTQRLAFRGGAGKRTGAVYAFSGSDVPMHYRKGHVSTGLEIQNSQASQADSTILLSFDLSRMGNSSYWGKIGIRINDESGKTVLTTDRKLAVYNTLHYVTRVNVARLTKGQYTIELSFMTQREDINPKLLLKQSTSVETVSFSIQ